MVSYVFRTAFLGGLAAGAQNHSAQETPSRAPRRSPRDLFLYYHRMVELAVGAAPVLVHPRGPDREEYRLQAEGGRFEVGAETVLRVNVFHRFMHFHQRQRYLMKGRRSF